MDLIEFLFAGKRRYIKLFVQFNFLPSDRISSIKKQYHSHDQQSLFVIAS